MSGFLIGAALLLVITLVLLIRPLWRRTPAVDFSRAQLNAAIYRDQLAELERDHAAGLLAQADYDLACTELQRRLLEDTTGEPATVPSAAMSASRALPIGLGLGMPLVAILLYLALGNPQAINPPPPQERITPDQIERMVAKLAEKLEKDPGNLKGWAMLARSYKAMGRYPEAVRAYEKTGGLLDSSADLLLDYADALAAVAGGFDKKTLALIERALKLEPDNPQALWMRGSAAFDAKQYDKAIADWEALQKLLPPESEEAKAIAANLAEARSRKNAPGKRK